MTHMPDAGFPVDMVGGVPVSLAYCTLCGAGSGITEPSGRTSPEMIRGGTRSPLFAIAWYIAAICTTVMDSPWPIGRLP